MTRLTPEQITQLSESMAYLDRESLGSILLQVATYLRPATDMSFVGSQQGDIGVVIFKDFATAAGTLIYLTENPDVL